MCYTVDMTMCMTDSDKEILRAVGKRLRELRRAAKRTQEELATAAGMHTMTLGDYERGSQAPTVGPLYRLACALGVLVSDLFPDQVSTAVRRKLLADLPQEDE